MPFLQARMQASIASMDEKSIDPSARVVRSSIGEEVLVREWCTVRDSTIGLQSSLYERVSVKKSSLGKGVTVNAGTYVEFADIGDNVLVGPNCSIVGAFHKFNEQGAEQQDTFERITIAASAFIGAGSVVLPGRNIGEGSVIGAGSVVSKDIPPFSIAFGVPPNQTIMPLAEWLAR